MSTPKPKPPLPPEAVAICAAMGWDEGQGRLEGGTLAVKLLAELKAAGWKLYPVPADYATVTGREDD